MHTDVKSLVLLVLIAICNCNGKFQLGYSLVCRNKDRKATIVAQTLASQNFRPIELES